MLISYNADLLPKVRMLGQIRYNEPWIHFSRCINEWVLYVIRDGNLYLQENGIRYHLTAGDFFLLEPGLTHEGYQRASCDYYYAHFTHPDMCRAGDDRQAIAELAEKRRESLVGYNLESIDPTSPTTYLPKQFHLAGGEFKGEKVPLKNGKGAMTAARRTTSAEPPHCCTAFFFRRRMSICSRRTVPKEKSSASPMWPRSSSCAI